MNHLHISNWERKLWLPLGVRQEKEEQKRDHLTEPWLWTIIASAGIR